MIVEERGEPSPDTEVELRFRILGIGPVHVNTLFLADHLQRECVVIAQEDGPLRGRRNWRRLLEDVQNRQAIFHAQRDKEPRHEGEMKDHMTLVAVAKVGGSVFWPLIGLCQQHTIWVVLVDVAAQAAQRGMRLWQDLASGALPLKEIGNGIETQPIDT